MADIIDAQGMIALLTAWALLFLFFGYCLGRIGKVKDILNKVWSEEVSDGPTGDRATERPQADDVKH